MNKTLLLIFSGLLLLTSCSSVKYGFVQSETEYDKINNWMEKENKSPKDLVNKLGLPVHAFYNKGKTMYRVYYPHSSKNVSMAEFMFNKELLCFIFDFDIINNQPKYQPSNMGNDTSCKVELDQIEIEPSLIK